MVHPSRAGKQISARLPLLWVALSFAAGLWVGKHLWRPASWWVIAAIVLCLGASSFLKKWIPFSFPLALGATFAIGALTIQVRGRASPVCSVSDSNSDQVLVTAHVISEGTVHPDGVGGFHEPLDVETEQIESDSQHGSCRIGVRLNIYLQRDQSHSTVQNRNDVLPILSYGQRIRFPAVLNAPRNFRNPGAFDYAGYLRQKGITALASTKYSNVEFLPGFADNRLELWRARAHRSIVQKIHRLWAEQIAGLMDAIVIGEDSFIERPTRVNFQRSGTLNQDDHNVNIARMLTFMPETTST